LEKPSHVINLKKPCPNGVELHKLKGTSQPGHKYQSTLLPHFNCL